ncbi:MAG: penicillin-binding protein activator [Gemmatimonadota bacterium]
MADSLYFAWRDGADGGDRAAQALWLEVRSLEEAGDRRRAGERLESLVGLAGEQRLRREAVRHLASLRARTADRPAAIRLLLEHPEALDDRMLELMRASANDLSVTELEALASASAASSKEGSLVRAALARALALSGETSRARAVAARVGDEATPRDRVLAADVLAGRVAPARDTLRVGVLLPLSGRFGSVGRSVLEGARIAFEEYAVAGEGPAVTLVVVDDSSRLETVPSRLAALEAEGVVAVLGPIRSRSLREAARARHDLGLLVLSPTATDARDLPPRAYSMWDRTRRENDVAADVGRWLVGDLGASRVGVLYPDTREGEREYLAFRAAVSRSGGYVADARAYEPDSTTFGGPIGALAAFAPDAVYVTAADERTVLQLAPQLAFYGLRGAIIAGGSAWAAPAVVRRLDPGFANGRIVGTYVDRTAPESAWTRFKVAYEKKYRKGLRNQLLPALGHDAMTSILAALPRDGLARPGAVARSWAGATALEGATGTFRPVPEEATVSRRTMIRVFSDRSLAAADVEDIWSRTRAEGEREEAREELRREQAEAKAEREAARRLRLREEAENR